MLLDTAAARLTLQHNELARVTRACGTRVQCVAGVAWITLDRDSRDIVLTRGQSFTVDRRVPLLLHAIHGPAAIELRSRAAPCPPARRTGGLGASWRRWWHQAFARPAWAGA